MMRKMLGIAACALALGCGAVTGPGTGSGTGSGNSVYWTEASGTVSGAVTGTFSKVQVTVEHVTGNNTGKQTSAVALTASVGNGDGKLVVTAPSGITDGVFVSSLGFTDTPKVGTYTQASTDICGGVELTISTGNTPSGVYGATATTDCNGNADSSQQGTFSLNLTSVTPSTTDATIGAAVTYYVVHGSLDATMPGQTIDSSGNATPATVTAHLTF